ACALPIYRHRAGRVDGVAPEGRGNQPDADVRRRVHRQLRSGDDDQFRPRAPPRIDAEVTRTAGHDEPDVAVVNVISPAGVDDDPADLFLCMRNLEPDGLRGVEESLDVALELEDAAVVGTNAFHDAPP